MKNKILFIISLVFLFLDYSYSDTLKNPNWVFYGEGIGETQLVNGKSQSHPEARLSTDWGESETAYLTWNNLSPGFYKISAYVRAEDVQKGKEGFSFWNFYDGGYGAQSPFVDLYGDYDSRKIEYIIKVKSSDLTIWFRLKSPGQVWINKFEIKKVEAIDNKIIIDSAKPNKLIQKNIPKFSPKISERKILYSFDRKENGHPFELKNKCGAFKSKSYYNFNIQQMPIKDWSHFDRLEMDIYNPFSSNTSFFVTLGDNLSNEYWSQTNFKQTLEPGWNKLNLSLNQMIGERGSHRFFRSINLSKLEKFFIWVTPSGIEQEDRKDFLIENIILTSNPIPIVPEGVYAFDFTSHKALQTGNLKQITTQTIFNDQRGFGFVDPHFWRVEDSQYTSEALRYTIGLLDGHFKIKLPNGKYEINLIIDSLGYWDVPFWSDRIVYANGTPIFKETRSTGKEFLDDLLKFENIVPKTSDNPYDLYLSKIFHPIVKTINVTNGYLDLEFLGDASGINLNTLILWNIKNHVVGNRYLDSFEKRNKDEFFWLTHAIFKKSKTDLKSSMSVGVIEPDLYLVPDVKKNHVRNNLNFLGGAGENPYQMIQLNPGNMNEKISWTIADLSNDKGESLEINALKFSELIYQYTSPDNNHETYMITGKYLKPLENHSIQLIKDSNTYLMVQLKITEDMPKGEFSGNLKFKIGSGVVSFPINITILPYTLPRIEFPVGFFGLDPIPMSYFKGKGYEELRRKYRYLLLDAIGEEGFTTFTGLPENSNDLDELFKRSTKFGIQTVYSYGGQYPHSLIDISGKTWNVSDEKFYKDAALELKKNLSKKNWPKIVYTFSDEASGYANNVENDINEAQKLKTHFPFLDIGGFGSFSGNTSNKLNSYFDYGFYSTISKENISMIIGNNHKWGIYNSSPFNLDDPRFSFGLGLYIARLNGLSQYLEWHATAHNNYPYYDFDGREASAVMFLPTTNGKLLHTLRFKFAAEGIHTFSKLQLLENQLKNNYENITSYKLANDWLRNIKSHNSFFSSPAFMSNKKNDFREFESQLNNHLKNIYLKKYRDKYL